MYVNRYHRFSTGYWMIFSAVQIVDISYCLSHLVVPTFEICGEWIVRIWKYQRARNGAFRVAVGNAHRSVVCDFIIIRHFSGAPTSHSHQNIRFNLIFLYSTFRRWQPFSARQSHKISWMIQENKTKIWDLVVAMSGAFISLHAI